MPFRQLTSRRRRRSRWGAAAVVVGLGTVIVGAVVWWGTAELWAPPARVISQELAHDSSIPVLVPVELPDGYVFRGMGRTVTNDDGEIAMAAWRYGPRAGRSDVPLVELCVSRRGEGLRDACAPDGLEVLASAQGARLRAVVLPLSGDVTDEFRELWGGVELTRHWEDVIWIDRRPIYP